MNRYVVRVWIKGNFLQGFRMALDLVILSKTAPVIGQTPNYNFTIDWDGGDSLMRFPDEVVQVEVLK